MGKLTLKKKAYLHVFVPVTAVFILNNLMLLTLETPGYIVTNILTYGLVVTISIISLRNFGKEKQTQVLFREDISEEAEAVEEVYAELKILLSRCVQKESLPIAKELAKICSELGPIAEELRVKSELSEPPKPSPFRQGSLRSAFRIAS